MLLKLLLLISALQLAESWLSFLGENVYHRGFTLRKSNRPFNGPILRKKSELVLNNLDFVLLRLKNLKVFQEEFEPIFVNYTEWKDDPWIYEHSLFYISGPWNTLSSKCASASGTLIEPNNEDQFNIFKDLLKSKGESSMLIDG